MLSRHGFLVRLANPMVELSDPMAEQVHLVRVLELLECAEYKRMVQKEKDKKNSSIDQRPTTLLSAGLVNTVFLKPLKVLSTHPRRKERQALQCFSKGFNNGECE